MALKTAFVFACVLCCVVLTVMSSPATLYRGLVIANPQENEAESIFVPEMDPQNVSSFVVTSASLHIKTSRRKDLNMTIV